MEGMDDDAVPTAPDIYPPPPPPPYEGLPIGQLCQEATPIASPTRGNRTLVTGRFEKAYSFQDCYNYVDHVVPAAVYQIQGTGASFDASVLQGPMGGPTYVTVQKGCSRNRGQPPPQPYYDENPSGEEIESPTSGGGATNTEDLNNNNHNVNLRHLQATSTEVEDSLEDTDGGVAPPDSYPYPYPRDHADICVNGHSDYGVRWTTVVGQMYTVIVHSMSSYDPPSNFALQLQVVDAVSICSDALSPPINLGVVTTSAGVSAYGTTEEGILITDLPTCPGFSNISPTVLYAIQVTEANVRVAVTIQGEPQVSIYKGSCDQGEYSCAIDDMTYPSMSDVATYTPVIYNREGENAEGQTSMESSVVVIDSPMPPHPSYTIDPLSWNNEVAGTSYLLAVNSGRTSAMGDFLLAINVSSYGNVCKDAVPINVNNTFTDRSGVVDKKIFPVFQSVMNMIRQ